MKTYKELLELAEQEFRRAREESDNAKYTSWAQNSARSTDAYQRAFNYQRAAYALKEQEKVNATT